MNRGGWLAFRPAKMRFALESEFPKSLGKLRLGLTRPLAHVDDLDLSSEAKRELFGLGEQMRKARRKSGSESDFAE